VTAVPAVGRTVSEVVTITTVQSVNIHCLKSYCPSFAICVFEMSKNCAMYFASLWHESMQNVTCTTAYADDCVQ